MNIDEIISDIRKIPVANYTIVAHGLGAFIANLFLLRENTEHVKKAIYIEPTLFGNPSALSTILSGENINNVERPFFRSIIRNYSCLLMSLPNPDVFGNQVLVQYDGKEYIAEDIYKLLSELHAVSRYANYFNISCFLIICETGTS